MAMARAAAESGTSILVATPHVHDRFPDVHLADLAGASQRLQTEVDRAGIPLQIVPGAEVSIAWAIERLPPDELILATYGQRGTDLLLETPTGVGAWQLERLVRPFQLQGLRVTLAHPERSQVFYNDPARLERLVERDVLLQVDADTLLGPARNPVRRLAEHLCRSGLAHVIASDGHSAELPRSVALMRSAVGPLEELVGPERAHWMTSDAPRAIVEGRPLPESPPVSGAGRRRWWSSGATRLRAR